MSVTKQMEYKLYLETYMDVIGEMETRMIPALRKNHSVKMMRNNIVSWTLACGRMIHRLTDMGGSDYPEHRGVFERERDLILGGLKDLERSLLTHTTIGSAMTLEYALIDNGKLAECGRAVVNRFRQLYREAGGADRPRV